MYRISLLFRFDAYLLHRTVGSEKSTLPGNAKASNTLSAVGIYSFLMICIFHFIFPIVGITETMIFQKP